MKFIVTMLCVALFSFFAKGIYMMVQGQIPTPFRRAVVQEIAPNKSWQEIGVIRWVHVLPGGGTIYSYSAPMTMGEAHRLMWSPVPNPNGARRLFFPKDTPKFLKAVRERAGS